MTSYRRQYTDEQRAAIVREATLPGANASEVAARHGMPLGTLCRWLSEDRYEGSSKPVASAWLLASDWHLGALVKSKHMAGRHHYDLNVARARVELLTESVAALLNSHSHTHDIKRLTILWAGDIIDGTKAYPGQQYNICLTSCESQRAFARSVIHPMLDLLASRLSVSCVAVQGNHGRAALKEPMESADHHELRMFEEIARDLPHLASWSVEQFCTEIKCRETGRMVIVEHGQFIPGSKHGGMTPGTLAHVSSRAQDLGMFPDVFAYGHRHTPMLKDGRTTVLCNGSMTGYNDFARNLGFAPCRPAQWMFGLSETGLAWVDLIPLGGWSESAPDENGIMRAKEEEE